MKKFIYLFAVVLSTTSLFAQDCKKTCKGKDIKQASYVLENDLIEAILYHDNGLIAQTGFYTKENKLQGEWISYDAAGNKTAIGQYNAGDKVGTWLFYQGDNMKEVTYSATKIASVKTWKIEDTRVVANRR